MATMYENLCGNCVGGVEFQNCAPMNCQRNVNSILPTELPYFRT
jgi:hypothetical protein